HALLGPSKGSRIGRRRGTSASPPEALWQDLYDVFLGMATSVVELCADSLSRDHVGGNYCFAHSRAGRLHEFKKSGSLFQFSSPRFMAARCHHGCDEQIFGADEQDPGRGQSDQGVFDPTRCRAERGRILVSAPLRQPTPAVNGWGLTRLPPCSFLCPNSLVVSEEAGSGAKSCDRSSMACCRSSSGYARWRA